MIVALLAVLLMTQDALAEGDAALRAGDYAAAERCYRRHLDEDPDSPEAQFGLARALAYSGRRREAIETYEALLARRPDYAEARVGYARVLLWEGKSDEAAREARRALDARPDDPDAWAAYGDALLQSGKPAEAAEAYGEWARLVPGDPAPLLARARANRAAGHEEAALQDQREAREIGIPPEQPWRAWASYSLRAFTEDRDDWLALSTGVRRHFARGSVSLEGLRSRRFSEWDDAAIFEGWMRLWRRASGNLRVQVTADADVLPELDAGLELYQGFGDSWEASGAYRRMIFPDDVEVDLFGGSLALYIVKDWYFRARLMVPVLDGHAGANGSLLARRYFGSPDTFADLEVGTGRDVVTVGPGIVETRGSYFVEARGQYFFSEHFGATGTLGAYGEQEGPESWSVTLGIVGRW